MFYVNIRIEKVNIMLKRIIFVVLSTIVSAFSVFFLIVMANYVSTYSIGDSFMRLGDAITWVVVLSLISCAGVSFIVINLVLIIKLYIKKHH